LSGAAGDAGRDVWDAAPEGADLAGGEFGVAGEANHFRSGHQIGCGQNGFDPCRVGLGAVTRQVTQPGGLEFTDPVLRPGVLAMAQFQAAELRPGDNVAMGGVASRQPLEDGLENRCSASETISGPLSIRST
jgi:hypothetical protein